MVNGYAILLNTDNTMTVEAIGFDTQKAAGEIIFNNPKNHNATNNREFRIGPNTYTLYTAWDQFPGYLPKNELATALTKTNTYGTTIVVAQTDGQAIPFTESETAEALDWLNTLNDIIGISTQKTGSFTANQTLNLLSWAAEDVYCTRNQILRENFRESGISISDWKSYTEDELLEIHDNAIQTFVSGDKTPELLAKACVALALWETHNDYAVAELMFAELLYDHITLDMLDQNMLVRRMRYIINHARPIMNTATDDSAISNDDFMDLLIEYEANSANATYGVPSKYVACHQY